MPSVTESYLRLAVGRVRALEPAVLIVQWSDRVGSRAGLVRICDHLRNLANLRQTVTWGVGPPEKQDEGIAKARSILEEVQAGLVVLEGDSACFAAW